MGSFYSLSLKAPVVLKPPTTSCSPAHLQFSEMPDMAQSGGCPQEALGTSWYTVADCRLCLTHQTEDLAWLGTKKKNNKKITSSLWGFSPDPHLGHCPWPPSSFHFHFQAFSFFAIPISVISMQLSERQSSCMVWGLIIIKFVTILKKKNCINIYT